MIEYNEECLLKLLFLLRGSVAPRASMWALPSAFVTWVIVSADDFIPGFRDSIGIFDELRQVSVLWGASTAVLAILLGFRTNRAMARFWEGTGLLHQMRGEWFDSVSCCVTFSRSALLEKPVEVAEFRHTIVRLMSLCHGSALEEISFSGGEKLETIDSMGLNDETLRHLKDCKQIFNFNRVEVLLHLIQSLITDNLDRGILKVAPPILSRVYQTLSRGFVNFLNAKKIADTRFPFPYAQTIAALSLLQTMLTPIMIASIVDNRIWAPIFTFVPIFGMFSLNFIGVELENPFGDDANDLPLDHFQTEMNRCLLMLLQDNADLMPMTHKTRCIKDFGKLFDSVHHHVRAGGGNLQQARSHCRISELFLDDDMDVDDLDAEGDLEDAPAFDPKTLPSMGATESLPARTTSKRSINFSEKGAPAAAVAAAPPAVVAPAAAVVVVPAAVPALLLPGPPEELAAASADSRGDSCPSSDERLKHGASHTSEQVRPAAGDNIPFSARRSNSPVVFEDRIEACAAQVANIPGAQLLPAAPQVWAEGLGDRAEATDLRVRLKEPPDRSLEDSVERFSAALQELRELVDDKLLGEFGRTSLALRSFSDALPSLLPTDLQPPAVSWLQGQAASAAVSKRKRTVASSSSAASWKSRESKASVDTRTGFPRRGTKV